MGILRIPALSINLISLTFKVALTGHLKIFLTADREIDLHLGSSNKTTSGSKVQKEFMNFY